MAESKPENNILPDIKRDENLKKCKVTNTNCCAKQQTLKTRSQTVDLLVRRSSKVYIERKLTLMKSNGHLGRCTGVKEEKVMKSKGGPRKRKGQGS